VTSPHISPVFVARSARCRAQWGFRPEGRGVVLDSTSSTPKRENAAGCGASPAAAETWRDMRAGMRNFSDMKPPVSFSNGRSPGSRINRNRSPSQPADPRRPTRSVAGQAGFAILPLSGPYPVTVAGAAPDSHRLPLTVLSREAYHALPERSGFRVQGTGSRDHPALCALNPEP